MSFGVQAPLTPTLNELNFLAAESEEAQQQELHDSALPDAPGGLKTSSKQYSFVPLPNTPRAKEARDYVLQLGSSMGSKMPQAEKPSFMSMTTASAYRPATQTANGEAKGTSTSPFSSRTPIQSKPPQTEPARSEQAASSTSCTGPTATTPQNAPSRAHTPLTAKENDKTTSSRETGAERKENNREAASPLASRKWSTEETREWWETRYHQKERQGDQQKNQDQQDGQEQDEHPLRVVKGGKSASKNGSSLQPIPENTSGKARKPTLTPPKMGVFALYYVLTKMGIQSDGVSNFSYKKEIEQVDGETTETHKKRLEELKEAIQKEQESTRWGVATKVFSWIGSIIGIISGVVLIATGVGAVAGSMLIIGGLIQIASQIMELTGGWRKVIELLPGDDREQKAAVVAWMQIGIAVLCLILSGVGVIWGGYASFGQATQTAMALMGGVASMGRGVTTIGQGINVFMFKDKQGDIKKFELRLAQLKHMRQDLMEKVEWGTDRLEKLFEDLSKALEFDEELFYADQMLYRR